MKTFSIKIAGNSKIYDVKAESIDNLRRNLIRDYDGKGVFVYSRYKKEGSTYRRYVGYLSIDEFKNNASVTRPYLWGEYFNPSIMRAVDPKTGKLLRGA